MKRLFITVLVLCLAASPVLAVIDVNGDKLELEDLVIIVKDYCTCLGSDADNNKVSCEIYGKWKRYKRGYIGRMTDYSNDIKTEVTAVWFYNPHYRCGDRAFPDGMGGAISFGELKNNECNDYNKFCPSLHLMKLDKNKVTEYMIDNWSRLDWIDYLERKVKTHEDMYNILEMRIPGEKPQCLCTFKEE